MEAARFELENATDGAVSLRLLGDWTTVGIGRLAETLAHELGERRVETLNLDDLGRFDTAGALALVKSMEHGLPAKAWSARPEAGRIYAMVEKLERESGEPPVRRPGWVRGFGKVGHGVYDFIGETVLSLAFLGRLVVASLAAIKNPKGIRWPALFSQIGRAHV